MRLLSPVHVMLAARRLGSAGPGASACEGRRLFRQPPAACTPRRPQRWVSKENILTIGCPRRESLDGHRARSGGNADAAGEEPRRLSSAARSAQKHEVEERQKANGGVVVKRTPPQTGSAASRPRRPFVRCAQALMTVSSLPPLEPKFVVWVPVAALMITLKSVPLFWPAASTYWPCFSLPPALPHKMNGTFFIW